MNLNQASVDKYYVVKKINGQGPLKRRIMDMGITKNTVLFVRKFAPLGDPIQLTVRGYELSLRKADAELVEVEETQGPKEEEA
ncbi:ferrous iron transport protein A [Peptoniphilus sp. EMRHCC_23]|uniref:FeoA family protein n=1 Tax=Peptoniphilus rachelemmaiella TaxID=2811779 RepID=UPI001C004460|nr:ferrous iron transport protein A [Peptoniphilus rachelemmaiella]